MSDEKSGENAEISKSEFVEFGGIYDDSVSNLWLSASTSTVLAATTIGVDAAENRPPNGVKKGKLS